MAKSSLNLAVLADGELADFMAYVKKLAPTVETKAALDAVKAEMAARRAAKAAERGKVLAAKFGF